MFRITLLATATLSLLAPPAAAQQCRTFMRESLVGSLTDERVDESSGLARSWTMPGRFWTHNDSGDSARIFLLEADGTTAGVVTLDVVARDWEDIATGPCAPGDDETCVYVGDIGDNDALYQSVVIHRFPEPTFGADVPLTTVAEGVESFEFTYDGGPRNAETLLVHPQTAEVFIVDKTNFDPNHLYRVPLGEGDVITRIATFDLGEAEPFSGRITGGDISPEGMEITLRTYDRIYTFCGPDVVTAFAAAPSVLTGFAFVQSETLAYSVDGNSFFTTSERDRSAPAVAPPLYRVDVTPSAGGDAAMTTDMGASRTDAGGPRPDAGTASPRPDVTIVVADPKDEPSRGCNCSTGPPLGGGLLLPVVFLLGIGPARRRRR